MRHKAIGSTLIVIMVCLILPSLVFGDVIVRITSTRTTGQEERLFSITTADAPAVSGAQVTGSSEYTVLSPQCNTTTVTGHSYFDAPSSQFSGTVLEGRYIRSSTVTGALNGIGVSSSVDFTIQNIVNDPSDFTGTTIGRSYWELKTTSGEIYRGTCYFYFKQGAYYSGYLDGDIHGIYEMVTTNPVTARCYITSIKGAPASGVLNYTYNSPVLYVAEPIVTHNISIWCGDAYSDVNHTGCREYSLQHSGSFFNIPLFNVCHYRGTWERSTGEDGSLFSYQYNHNPGVNALAPRLTGLTEESAKSLITSLGFTVGTITYDSSNPAIPGGRVSSQSVNTAGLLNLGTAINLTVSQFTLTASVPGGHGTISPTTGKYNPGAKVTLTATPDNGYRVSAWHGTGNDASTAGTNTVTMDSDRTITVDFSAIPAPVPNTYTLTTSVSGGNGTIDPPTGAHDQGTKVTLTATPDAGYQISAWHGTDDDSSKATTNTVTMNGDKVVSVEYAMSSSSGENSTSGGEGESTSTPDNGEENTTKDEEDGGSGGGGGGCFISASASSSSPVIPFLGILLLSWICIMRRYESS